MVFICRRSDSVFLLSLSVRGLIWQHTLTTCSWQSSVLENNFIFKQPLYSPEPHLQFNQKTVSLTVILWQKLNFKPVESNDCFCWAPLNFYVYNHATIIVISDSQRVYWTCVPESLSDSISSDSKIHFMRIRSDAKSWMGCRIVTFCKRFNFFLLMEGNVWIRK